MADHRRRKDVRRQIIQKVVLLMKYHLFSSSPHTPYLYKYYSIYGKRVYIRVRAIRVRAHYARSHTRGRARNHLQTPFLP